MHSILIILNMIAVPFGWEVGVFGGRINFGSDETGFALRRLDDGGIAALVAGREFLAGPR